MVWLAGTLAGTAVGLAMQGQIVGAVACTFWAVVCGLRSGKCST